MMKIKENVWYKNQTKRYVLPALKYYGKDFLRHISNIMKVAVGVGDTILQEDFPNHIFFLINTRVRRKEFILSYAWFKENGYLIKDYAYDDIHTGYLQMLVFKLPPEKPNMVKVFLTGKFSKLYTTEEIKKFFGCTPDKYIVQILTKDEGYRMIFLEIIKKMYNLNLDYDEYFGSNPDSELDIKPMRKHEYFNHL